MEEWKKVASQLDKDHAKGMLNCKHTQTCTDINSPSLPVSSYCLEYKKARADIKKKSSDTIKLQKKVKKGKNNKCLHHIHQVFSSTEINTATIKSSVKLHYHTVKSKNKVSINAFT